jgi:nitroimidazol reductase NimA-like FMN-containing flavoprotein (pyridoxamine 5'-phosphate oxidase superfamily)
VKVECPQWVESGHWRVPAKEVFERVAGEALEGSMDDSAIEILDTQRTMAISTLRPDGWPQTTIVGYVNEDLTLYFLIFRTSQKLANIRRDKRISIAVGGDTDELDQLTAVYAAAHASEVKDPKERGRAWNLLQQRHPNLVDFELPEPTDAAMIKATCQFISVLDYRKGPGHIDDVSIDDQGAARQRARTDQWGSTAAKPGHMRPKGSGR